MSLHLNKPLQKLVESLLNATIMLAIILVISAVVLVSKVQNFTEDVAQNVFETIGDESLIEISARLDSLDETSQDIRKISDQLQQGQHENSQIAELRSDVQAVEKSIDDLKQTIDDLGLQAVGALAQRMSMEIRRHLSLR